MSKKSKFQKGQSVIIIGDRSAHGYSIGSEVVIQTISRNTIWTIGIDHKGNENEFFVFEDDIREKTEADLVQQCNKTSEELFAENSPVEEEKMYTREEVRKIARLAYQAATDGSFIDLEIPFNKWFDKNVK